MLNIIRIPIEISEGKYYISASIEPSAPKAVRFGDIAVQICRLEISTLDRMVKKYKQFDALCTEKTFDAFLKWFEREACSHFGLQWGTLLHMQLCHDADLCLRNVEQYWKNAQDFAREYNGVSETIAQSIRSFYLTARYGILMAQLAAKAFLNVAVSEDPTPDDIQGATVALDLDLSKNQEMSCRFIYQDGRFAQVYLAENLFGLISLDVYHFITMNSMAVKKCAFCDNFFIPQHRSDEVYCIYPSPNNPNKTCREEGTQQAYKEKLRGDIAAKLYRNIYMARQNRAIRYEKKDPVLGEVYRSAFNAFRDASKKWKQDVKDGIKTRDEYIEWLQAERETKV